MTVYSDIEPVKIPPVWKNSHAVTREAGTRWYIEEGPPWRLDWWLNELYRHMAEESRGPLVPLQWVPDIVGVSRTAVQKRAKGGGLTVFSFIIMYDTRFPFGRWTKRRSKLRYDLVPFSECKQWQEILDKAANYKDELTE